jgi:hypothetical protein
VFITDGEFGDPSPYYHNDKAYDFWSHWKDVKRRTGMQAFGISFDCGPNQMEQLVDTVIELNSMMANPKSMAEVFRRIEQ